MEFCSNPYKCTPVRIDFSGDLCHSGPMYQNCVKGAIKMYALMKKNPNKPPPQNPDSCSMYHKMAYSWASVWVYWRCLSTWLLQNTEAYRSLAWQQDFSVFFVVGENFKFNKDSVLGPSTDLVYSAKQACFRIIWNILCR